MRKKPKPASKLTATEGGLKTDSETAKATAARQQFLIMAVNMSWQLAIVVLVPVIGGVELDKKLKTSYILFVGLAVAVIGSVLVMWRTMQAANRLPVPKLTSAQKRTIRKSYEAEDDE
jgi:putative F0F1-ATPase subunit (Ca2+/Mg2+ transporter)